MLLSSEPTLLNRAQWMAELLISECVLYDSKGKTEVTKVLSNRSSTKASRKFLYDMIFEGLKTIKKEIEIKKYEFY